MMLGLATATIVESSKIMKKPTIIVQSAFHGLAVSAGFFAVAPPTPRAPPPDRPRAVAVVMDSPSAGNPGKVRRPQCAQARGGHWCRWRWLGCGCVSVPVVANTCSAGGVVGALSACAVRMESGRGAAEILAAGPSRSWVQRAVRAVDGNPRRPRLAGG